MFRKSMVVALAFILCAWAEGYALADTIEQMQLHPWSVGSEMSFITYKEPGVMSEKGLMYGLGGSYTYVGGISQDLPYLDQCVFQAEMRGSFGQVDYKGSGEIDNIDNYLFETRATGGYGFTFLENTMLIPYLGVGYRFLLDDGKNTSSSTLENFYERRSQYIYSPIGIKAVFDLGNNWSVGPALEYDVFWQGIQRSFLSQANPGWNDVKNIQEKGAGVRAALTVQFNSNPLDLVIEPFIRYWSIERSKGDELYFNGAFRGYAFEPKNNSTEIGIRLGINF